MEYNDLFIANYNEVYKLCLSYLKNQDLAMDVTQETYIHVYDKIDTLRDTECFHSWVNKIAINIAKNIIIRDINRHLPLEESLHNHLLQEKSVEEHVFESFNKMALRKAIMNLPYTNQEIIILYYHCNYSYREISEILSIAIGTVKSRLYRSRQMLLVILKEEIC